MTPGLLVVENKGGVANHDPSHRPEQRPGPRGTGCLVEDLGPKIRHVGVLVAKAKADLAILVTNETQDRMFDDEPCRRQPAA